MIQIQVVPSGDLDAHKLLKSKIRHGASTWFWANKARTRLRHKGRAKGGYVEVRGAGGILVARVVPARGADHFYLAEKLIGRLVGWFEDELVAINIQFVRD